jgi:hypothetical protein
MGIAERSQPMAHLRIQILDPGEIDDRGWIILGLAGHVKAA